jgi:NADP-dependent 3-hydroxy acid dehydrogenase YdfG
VNLQLDGKVTPVTGASKGIGRYVAEHPVTEGTGVAIRARTPGPLGLPAKEFQSATGRRVLALTGDMSVTRDVTRCKAATEDRIGPIGILVTCAASSPGACGQIREPAGVAALVTFLAPPGASFITGPTSRWTGPSVKRSRSVRGTGCAADQRDPY